MKESKTLITTNFYLRHKSLKGKKIWKNKWECQKWTRLTEHAKAKMILSTKITLKNTQKIWGVMACSNSIKTSKLSHNLTKESEYLGKVRITSGMNRSYLSRAFTKNMKRPRFRTLKALLKKASSTLRFKIYQTLENQAYSQSSVYLSKNGIWLMIK